MPARAVLYVVVSAVVMATLAVSAILVFSYRQPVGVAEVPSPTAGSDHASPDASSALPSETTPPVTPPATRDPIESLAKQTQPESEPPEQLKGYRWPVKNALITSRLEPRPATEGGFVIINGQESHDGLDLATFC